MLLSNQRRWLFAFWGWLFLLPVLGQIHDGFSLSLPSLAWVYVAAILPLAWNGSRLTPKLIYGMTLLGGFVATKVLSAWLGGLDASLPTVPEVTLLSVTGYVSYGFALRWRELQMVLGELTRISLPHRYPDLMMAEQEIERELRRARRYERPLSVITVQPPKVDDIRSPQTWESIREHLTRQYALSQLTEVLQKETKTTDLVSFHNGQFVLLLPETKHEEAAHLAERLDKRVREIFSTNLNAGIASFPNEETTIYGLMERSRLNSTAQHQDSEGKGSPVITEEPVAELV